MNLREVVTGAGADLRDRPIATGPRSASVQLNYSDPTLTRREQLTVSAERTHISSIALISGAF